MDVLMRPHALQRGLVCPENHMTERNCDESARRREPGHAASDAAATEFEHTAVTAHARAEEHCEQAQDQTYRGIRCGPAVTCGASRNSHESHSITVIARLANGA